MTEQYPARVVLPRDFRNTSVSERACVPVIDSLGKYLYRIPLKLAEQYLRGGRVVEVPWNGTHAVMATAEHLEYIKTMRPPLGQRYSHRSETPDNIRGVWTFRKLQPPASNGRH